MSGGGVRPFGDRTQDPFPDFFGFDALRFTKFRRREGQGHELRVGRAGGLRLAARLHDDGRRLGRRRRHDRRRRRRRGRRHGRSGDDGLALAAGQDEVAGAGPELDGRPVEQVDRLALFPELGVHDDAVLRVHVELPLVPVGVPADREVPPAHRFAVARAHEGSQGLVGGVRVRPPQEHLRVRDVQVDVRQPVWKSTSASGALIHFSAMTRPVSGEEPASPRHRAGIASMAWRTTR